MTVLRDMISGLPPEAVALVERLGAEAQLAWPEVDVPPEEFARYVAERLLEGDPLASLRSVHAPDLYLACACVRGDARALRLLETTHFGMIEGAVAQLRASTAQIDEVKQTVREEVLVGAQGKPPALAGYSGRGALGEGGSGSQLYDARCA